MYVSASSEIWSRMHCLARRTSAEPGGVGAGGPLFSLALAWLRSLICPWLSSPIIALPSVSTSGQVP